MWRAKSRFCHNIYRYIDSKVRSKVATGDAVDEYKSLDRLKSKYEALDKRKLMPSIRKTFFGFRYR